jgi:outer membrane protein insertion porin family
MVQLSFSRALSIANVAASMLVLSSDAVGLWRNVAQAQTLNTQPADSIVVEGNQRVEASTVRSYFKAGSGGRLDAQVIDDAYKALYATGLFQDVRISQSRNHIVVTLVESPIINRIAFKGNKKVKEDQLSARAKRPTSKPLTSSATRPIPLTV